MAKSTREVAATVRAEPSAGKPFPEGLAQPARRALASAGYEHLERPKSGSEASLLALHGSGPDALGRLRAALRDAGLVFAAAEAGTAASMPE